MKYNQSQFAKSLGLSRAAISKAVKVGRVRLNLEGKIDSNNKTNKAYISLHEKSIKAEPKIEKLDVKKKSKKEGSTGKKSGSRVSSADKGKSPAGKRMAGLGKTCPTVPPESSKPKVVESKKRMAGLGKTCPTVPPEPSKPKVAESKKRMAGLGKTRPTVPPESSKPKVAESKKRMAGLGKTCPTTTKKKATRPIKKKVVKKLTTPKPSKVLKKSKASQKESSAAVDSKESSLSADANQLSFVNKLTIDDIEDRPDAELEKIKHQIMQMQIKLEKERLDLIPRKLVQVVLGQQFTILQNEFIPMGTNIGAEVAGLMGIDDNETIIEIGKFIESRCYKINEHIKKRMNDLLKKIKAKLIE